MALAEDAATILDEFVHDVANLPAEIAHLLEEIQAKDTLMAEYRQAIYIRDASLQAHVKKNGGHVKHPKDEQFTKSVMSNFDKAQALQEDKVALSEKAALLLDRHVKRLDLRIRNLQSEGSMLEDAQLPSLLHTSPANLVEPVSANRSGVSTPLHNFNFGPGTGPGTSAIANAAMARMAMASSQANRGVPQAPMAGMQPHLLLGSGPTNQRPVREGSAGANDAKRRRPNVALGTLTIPSSNLARGASAGPGTPKAATPVSRAGSLGPRSKKITKKPPTTDHPLRKKLNKGGLSKKAARRLKNGNRASPSTTGDDNSDASGSDEDNVSQSHGVDGAEEDEMGDGAYEEDGDDNEIYCICRNPSHGNMIACDNAKCKYEWFHYECVGLKEEPKGKWLCPNCRTLPPTQVKMSK